MCLLFLSLYSLHHQALFDNHKQQKPKMSLINSHLTAYAGTLIKTQNHRINNIIGKGQGTSTA